MVYEDISELITYSTALIKSHTSEGLHPEGTGFFMNLCNRGDGTFVPVLMTNKHVMEGLASFSFDMCHMDEEKKPIDTQVETYHFKNRGWIQHPSSEVDLCCFPIAPILESETSNGFPPYYKAFSTDLIPRQNQWSDFSAIEDVYMIGYPTGISDSYNNKPVYRKGITATHLKHDYRGRKEFLIDCPCYGGSSGSPVIILNQGSYSDKSLQGIVLGTRFHLLGVQYGTHLADLYEYENSIEDTKNIIYKIPNNLGLVIKSELILDFEPILDDMRKSETESQTSQ